MNQALEWIGFGTEYNSNSIYDEGGLEAFENFASLTESNIRYMAFSFSKRTSAQGRVNYGMRRVKYTIGIMHWAKDESPCSSTAYLIGIVDSE